MGATVRSGGAGRYRLADGTPGSRRLARVPGRSLGDSAATEVPSFGRGDEMRKLDLALVAARSGRGSSWLVTGPAGIGKSRFLREVGLDATRRGFSVLWAYGLRGTSLPLFTLLQLLEPSPTEGQFRSRHTARSMSRRRAGVESVDATILALLRDLDRACAQRPHLVAVDDLQHADVESLRGLRLLIRRFADRPVVFLLAARTGGPAPVHSPAIEAQLGDVIRSGQLAPLELRPLPAAACLQLAAAVLGQTKEVAGRPEGLRDLLELAGGSPYFVIEVARAYGPARPPSMGGPVEPIRSILPEAGSTALRLPAIVNESLLARYRSLPRPARRAIDLAARLGFEFDAEALAIAFDEPLRSTVGMLDRLSNVQWPIRRLPGDTNRYTFDHALLHALLLEQGDAPGRSVLRRVVRWWSDHRTDDPVTETRLRLMVGDRRGAVSALARSIDGAIRQQAFRLVGTYLTDFTIDPAGDGELNETLVRLYGETVQQLRERWQWAPQRAALDHMARLTLSEEERWKVRCWRLDAEAFSDRGKAQSEVEALAREIESLPPSPLTEAHRLLAYLQAVLVHTEGPDRSAAERTLGTAVRLLDDRVHDFELFRVLISGAMTFPNWGRYAEARAWTARAREVLHRGSLRSAWLGELLRRPEWVLELRAGDLERGLRLARENVRSAQRSKNPSLEASALLNLGIYEFEIRELDSAEASLRAAGELSANLDQRFGLLWTLVLRGLVHVALGDWNSAEELFARCRPILVETNSRYESWIVQLGLAYIRAGRGDPTGAMSELPQSPAPGPDPKAFAIEYRCIRSRILELGGDPVGAKALLEEALRAASRSRIPTERAEALVHLAEWERRNGTEVRRQRCIDRIRAIRLPGGSDLLVRRRGIACADIAGSLTERSLVGSRASIRLRTGAPLGQRILSLLRSHPSGPPWATAPGRPTGWSERDIAQGLGVRRESIARTLGRLLRGGEVERTASRVEGGARRVYLYRFSGTTRGESTGGG